MGTNQAPETLPFIKVLLMKYFGIVLFLTPYYFNPEIFDCAFAKGVLLWKPSGPHKEHSQNK